MIIINNLAQQMGDVLSQRILDGSYPLGSRLPTEERLAAEFGVSRSVVREAIARLKSDGVVTTRQGRGAFVAESFASLPFRISAAPHETEFETSHIFELRMAVEAEAAALAAKRRTGTQLKRIGDALRAVNAAAFTDSVGAEEDLAFHRAIAAAAGNPLFERFLVFLELHISSQLAASRQKSRAAHRLKIIEDEHGAIYDAIRSQDAESARVALLAHLRSGIKRLGE